MVNVPAEGSFGRFQIRFVPVRGDLHPVVQPDAQVVHEQDGGLPRGPLGMAQFSSRPPSDNGSLTTSPVSISMICTSL